MMMVKMLPRSCLIWAVLLLLSCTQGNGNVYAPPNSAPVVMPPAEITRLPSPVARPEGISKYGNPPSYVVFGQRYAVLPSASGYVETGRASWYGPGFHEKLTSTREPYDMYAMTAAHKTLPIPCFVEVTNLENGRSIVVRVNDRGPFVAGRIIDLSYVAAQKLDIIEAGTAAVRVVALTTPTNQVVNYAELSGTPALARGHDRLPVADAVMTQDANAIPAASANYAAVEQPIFLQLGAFVNQDNALALQAKLSQQIVQAVMVFSDSNNGRLLHRVQIGPLSDRAEALATKDQLYRLGHREVKLIGISE